MKTRFWIPSLLALFLFIGLPDNAQAQTSFAVGPRIGIGLGDSPSDSPYIGADLRATTPALPVDIDASFDYYFVDLDNYSLFRFAANAIYPFGIDNELFTPYAGGGLSIARSSIDVPEVNTPQGTVGGNTSDTDAALNVLGGARFQVSGFNPFVQAHFTLGGDLDLFGITAGLLFGI